MAELLHSRTTPARVAIAEWVELARTYSGEPARRLLNGVLGRVARRRQTAGRGRPPAANRSGKTAEQEGALSDRFDL